MSWSRGSELFDSIIDILKDKVEDIPLREEIFMEMIPLFEDHDCDDLDDCIGNDVAFDNVFHTMRPMADDDSIDLDEPTEDFETTVGLKYWSEND